MNRKFLLIDTWDVRHQHLLITGFSIAMFVTYWTFMWLLCSMTPSLTTALLLLGSQIGLGLPATRAFYDFGVAARGMLKFYDAGMLGTDVELEDLKIRTGDVPLFFERLDLQIRKYDSSVRDDLNDLAWFTIVVWAVISSTGIFASITGIRICALGSFVLLITCFVSYVGGYRTAMSNSFEEDLHHLEYYVDTRIKSADQTLPKANGKVILQASKKGRLTVLIDIIVEFNLQNDSIIEYHLGLSSHRKERFIIVTSHEYLDVAYSKFKDLPVLKKSNWILEQITTQSGPIIRIVNTKSRFCVCDRSTFIVDHETIKKNILATNKILTDISTILNTDLHPTK